MGNLLGTIGTIAGSALGGPVGGAIGGALGSAIGGSSQQSAVSNAYNTAQQQSTNAAQAAKFVPIGITNRFGSSKFGYDTSGNLVGAGYTLSPELQALQDYMAGQTAAGQADSQRLLSLGRGYLAQSPEAAAQQYMTQQQGLLAPSREQQLAGIQNRLFQTGRGGLATGGTTAGYTPGATGLMASNPELAAYYNSIAQQDAQLAADAQKAAQQRITYGQGLLSSAYAPITTPFQTVADIEKLGQQPFALSSELAGRSATAAAATLPTFNTAAQTGLAGQIATQGLGASQATAIANQLPTSQISSWFNGLIGGGGNTQSNSPFAGVTGFNPGGFTPTYGTSFGGGFF